MKNKKIKFVFIDMDGLVKNDLEDNSLMVYTQVNLEVPLEDISVHGVISKKEMDYIKDMREFEIKSRLSDLMAKTLVDRMKLTTEVMEDKVQLTGRIYTVDQENLLKTMKEEILKLTRIKNELRTELEEIELELNEVKEQNKAYKFGITFLSSLVLISMYLLYKG